jgi:hypothetical protein
MSPRRPAALAFALLLLWPTVLPTFLAVTAGDESTASHPASCACPEDACGCEHGATLTSCAIPDLGWTGCGLQGSACGPKSPRALAWYWLGLYEPPSTLQLSPPPPREASLCDAVPVAHSVTLSLIEHPPEPRA